MSGRFSARISDLEPLAALLGLTGAGGRLQAEGSIEGPWSGIAGRLAVTLRQPVYGSVRFEEGSLAARLAGGRIVLDSLQLRQGGLRVEASGELDPRSMRGAVRADLAAGDAAPGRLTASFAMPRGGALRLDASGEGLPLGPLSAISPTLPAIGGTLRFAARMHRAAPAEAAPAPAPLQAEASWTVSDPRFRELRMSSLEGRLVLAEGRLRVEGLDLRGPGARLQAAAAVGLDTRRGRPLLSAASPFNGSLQGENVDLRVLTPFLPPAMRVGGRLNGRMEWSGSLKRPEPRGTLAVSGGSLSLSPEAPSLAGAALEASFQGSTLSLESLTATVQGVPVSLSGTLHTPDFEQLRFDLNAALSGWGSLDASGTVSPGQLSVDSRVRSLDLRLAGLFVPALQSLRGTLTGTLAVRGTPAVPQVTGTVEGTGLGYRLPGLADPLSGGALRLSFEGRRVDVQSLAARLGKGSVSAGGTLSWGLGGLEQADLDVGLRALSLAKPGVYRVSLRSAELRFHGSGDQYSLEGDVEPGDSRLLQNIQPASVIEFLRSLQRPSRPLPLFLAKTRLNVRLRNADSLWMQNNLGRVRLTAALTVLGTATQPAVAGRVTVQDGYVTFLDRRFSITRGTADFADVARMNPVLDLEARTEVKFYQQLQSVPFAIVLTLAGPLETVEVALSSDPPLSQANIVSLLALGTLRSEGPGGLNEERSTGQVLLERAGELASEQFSRYVGEGAKDLLGLDEFTVTGNLFNLGRDQDNPELTASKQLTDRLELSYSTNLGPFDQHDLSMDYQLSENLSLEGKVNQAGEAEVRLKLGIRLK